MQRVWVVCSEYFTAMLSGVRKAAERRVGRREGEREEGREKSGLSCQVKTTKLRQ